MLEIKRCSKIRIVNRIPVFKLCVLCFFLLFPPQVRDCEHQTHQWESEDSWYIGVRRWRIDVDTLQRKTPVQVFSLSVCCGRQFCSSIYKDNAEMDYWCDSFDLRNPLLVILVHSTIKDKQEIPMPVFQHSPHELLWSHSISCHLLPH